MKAELTANAAQGDEAVTALLIEKLTALQRETEALKEELKTVRKKAKEERENAEEAIEEAERQTDEKITKATKEAQILPSTVATLSLSSNAALYFLLRRKRR
ncbi:MAG: hypothetical protein IJW34_08925 [Clostridia bacterium]|nr:hypothetical protein [Clostridia bacterium]